MGYSDIGAVWEVVAISGISPDMGVYAHDNIIGAWQQFFLTFHGKRQQGGRFIKCAEVRTKKEFCYTIMRRRKIRENSSKKEFLYTIHA